jgi:hypothetical protein
LLKKYKNKIKEITFLINDISVFSLEYLQAVKNLGIPMIGECKNSENMAVIREHYFDFLIEEEKLSNEKTVEELRQKQNLKFLTKKDVFSSGKRYYSKAHADTDQQAKDKWGEVIDSPEFWKDLDHYYIYESF